MPAVTAFLAQDNARRTLECGVTPVRDLDAADFTDIASATLVARGAMTGPAHVSSADTGCASRTAPGIAG